MSPRLTGMVAVVTGAGGGLGRAEATLLARHGAQVVVNNHIRPDHDGPPAAEVVADAIVAAGGVAVASTDSVADPAGARRIVDTAIEAFGRLDIVVNNAGAARVAPVETMTDESWDVVLDACLRGTFLVSRAAIPHLRERPGSVIVNTTSESGRGHAYMAGYAAAKEGVVGLTRSLARELASHGVRCNAVSPRALGTALGDRYLRDAAPYAEELARLGRFRVGERAGVGSAGSAEEAAPLVVWLCTRAAAHLTGRTFSIEGDAVGVWSEPVIERSCARTGGWTLDALDEHFPNSVGAGMDEHPLSTMLAGATAGVDAGAAR